MNLYKQKLIKFNVNSCLVSFLLLFIAAPMFATAQTAVNAQQNLTGASMIQILHFLEINNQHLSKF